MACIHFWDVTNERIGEIGHYRQVCRKCGLVKHIKIDLTPKVWRRGRVAGRKGYGAA